MAGRGLQNGGEITKFHYPFFGGDHKNNGDPTQKGKGSEIFVIPKDYRSVFDL